MTARSPGSRAGGGGGSLRAALALTRPTLRLLPWGTVGTAAATGTLLVWLASRDPAAGAEAVVTMLRPAGAALVVAVASGLEDPTGETLAGTVVTVAVRRWLQVALMLPVAGAAWWGLLVLGAGAPALADAGTATLPTGALCIEAVAMLAVGLATAAVVPPDTRLPGAVAVLALLGALLRLP